MSSPSGDKTGHEEGEDSATQAGRERDLKELAPKLIHLEVWCRQREYDDIANFLSAAIDMVDHELTRPSDNL